MDDQRRPRREEDDETTESAEGVRIIGPDEAAEAMERGDVTPRRNDDELRFGDRPPAPPEGGPRPSLRFPLDASADPSRIERPPVQPAPDPVTGPVELPHWTEPPTGEVPAVLIGDDSPLIDDDGDDVDAWSSFATSTPRWRDADDDWSDDGGFVESLSSDSDEVRIGALGDLDAEPTHDEYFGFDDLEERVGERTGEPASADADPDVWNEAGDDWNESDSWDDDSDGGPSAGRSDTFDDDAMNEPDGNRDMTMAWAVGGGLGVAAIVLLILGPMFAVMLVTAIMTLAAVEYFGVMRKVGWEAATPLGIVACAAFPLAVYWKGPLAYPLVGFLVVVAVLSWYLVGAGGREPMVLGGAGATLLGVFWIGGLGSSAAAMLAVPDGTALLVAAILATVAYDVGGLFVGRAIGSRPLSAASPNKTVEGLVAGMAAAFVAVLAVVGIWQAGPWTGPGAALALGVGAAVAAPLGDLCQSLLKRDLGVKDMSQVLPGHGGVLDRFDGMLFVLPTVFWLAMAVGPLG